MLLSLFHLFVYIFKMLDLGLIDLSCELDGAAWNLEPFTPGCVEEYEIDESGRATIKMKKPFYSIGDKPYFKPLIPYDCEL
jgi:hypothetical protein